MNASSQTVKLNWRDRKSQTLYQAGLRFRMFLAILLIFSSLFSRTFNLNNAVIAIYAVYLALTFWTNSRFLSRYISFYISVLLAVGSTAIIESNRIWLGELRTWSSYAGALPLFAAYYMVFLLSLECFDNFFRQKNVSVHPITYAFNGRSVTRNIIQIGIMLFFCILAASFAHVIRYPAFMINIDRFLYLSTYVTGIWAKLRSYLLYLVSLPLIGYKFGYKKSCMFLLIFYAVYLAWTGERLTNFILLLYYVPIILLSDNQNTLSEYRKTRKASVWVWLTLLIFFLMIFWVVFRQYNGVSSNALEQISARFAMQGQLWWSIYNQFSGQAPHIGELGNELRGFVSADPTNPDLSAPLYGIYKIMYLCAPRALVAAKIALGQTYTESTAASIFYYLGPPAIFLFALLSGFVFAWILEWYRRSVLERRLLESTFVLLVAYNLRRMWAMSSFFLLSKRNFLISVTIVLLLHTLRRPVRTSVVRSYPVGGKISQV